MLSLHESWRPALAGLLLAVLPVAVVSASPAAGAFDPAGSIGAWVEEWAGGWIAWLLPGRETAGAEAAPAEPPTAVVPDDDASLAGVCGVITCTEGRLMPDFDPDGDR